MGSKLISFSIKHINSDAAETVLNGISKRFNVICVGIRSSSTSSYQTKFYFGGN